MLMFEGALRKQGASVFVSDVAKNTHAWRTLSRGIRAFRRDIKGNKPFGLTEYMAVEQLLHDGYSLISAVRDLDSDGMVELIILKGVLSNRM